MGRHTKPRHDSIPATPQRTVAAFPGAHAWANKGYGPLHAPTDPSPAFGFCEKRGHFTVATWSGRPISKWCRYGFWREDGAELMVTRIL